MLVVWLLLLAATTAAAHNLAPLPASPDLTESVPHRYIVVFEPGTAPAVAAEALISNVKAQLAVSGQVQAASAQSLTVLHTLEQHAGSSGPSSYPAEATREPVPASGSGLLLPPGADAQPTVAATQEPLPVAGGGLPSPGLQGVVMHITHPAALAAVKAASSVRAVVPDRVVAAQQQPPSPACIDPQQLSKGLAPTVVAKLFFWQGCKNSAAELRWIGERCGADLDQIRYTAVYAVYNNTDLLVKSGGQDCVLTLNATAHPTWNNVRFGSCGKAPSFAPSLPTCIRQPAATAPTGLEQDNSSSSGGGGGSSTPSCADPTRSTFSTPRFSVAVTLSVAVPCGSQMVRSITYWGTSCGPNKAFVQWYRAAGMGCTLLWRQGQVKYNNDLFGNCGVPPGIPPADPTMALPTLMCPQEAAKELSPSPSPSNEEEQPSPSPSPSPSLSSPSPSPSGEASPSPLAPSPPSPSPSPDEPSPSPAPLATLPSPSPDLPSPSPSPSSDLPPPSPSPSPSLPSPSPSPTPPSPSPAPEWQLPPGALPRSALAAGEKVPNGVRRIEASTPAGVVNSGTLPAGRQLLVAVMDSGIDSGHPDLNYAGGVSWVAAPGAAKPNDVAANVDNLGHGTHIAGTIGARNNGAGVVGVSPGVPLYSLKVLDGDGRGMLSTVISAMKWVVGQGVRQGVRVVNISLAAFVDPKSPDYATTKELVCSVFKEASDAGVLVVVAAGNYGGEVEGYLPGSCPTVAIATALDSDGLAAASFSNYVPVEAPASELARVVAAPGSYILSTVSYAAEPSGYGLMSGTSMAAPHVAGVAANCMLNGACPSGSGYANLAVMQAAAQQRYQLAGAKAYGFRGDPYSGTAAERHYGLLVWSGGC